MSTNMSKRSTYIFNLVLGGIMVAMATVLGFLKLWEAPYGGSITVCSMLPILFYSYRCGLKWGLGAAFVNSALQLLLGASALRGLSVGTLLGSIFLDYILAFAVLGLGGAVVLAPLLPLAVATSIDALAVGVSFAAMQVSIGPAVALIGVTTCCLSAVGVKVGNLFGMRYKAMAERAGGFVLILMGAKILLEGIGIL